MICPHCQKLQESRDLARSEWGMSVIRKVARDRGLKPALIVGRSKVPAIVSARYEVFRILQEDGWTMNQIGTFFGIHHSTVLYALKLRKKAEVGA